MVMNKQLFMPIKIVLLLVVLLLNKQLKNDLHQSIERYGLIIYGLVIDLPLPNFITNMIIFQVWKSHLIFFLPNI